VAGGWTTLHNKEPHNLYASLNDIKMIKSRRITGARPVARKGEIRNTQEILVEKSEGKTTRCKSST
jgi:hypothetical protein